MIHDDLVEGLAVALRKRRQAIGLKLWEARAVSNVSSLVRIESGTQAINTRVLFKLAAAYGVKPSDLMREAEEYAQAAITLGAGTEQ